MIKRTVLITLFFSAVALAQQSGRPNQIRVLTDANGYLLVAAASQTNPISQPTVFTNTRLRTDASGNLVVVCSGCSSGSAPLDATYITQTSSSTLTNEQALASLATGILKSTTTTGVVSIALSGTDYQAPITISDTQVLFADGANNPVGTSGMEWNKTTKALSFSGNLPDMTNPITVRSGDHSGSAALIFDDPVDSYFVLEFSHGGGGTDWYVNGNWSISAGDNFISMGGASPNDSILFGATNSFFTGNVRIANGSAFRGDTTSGHTFSLCGYDNNTGPGYVCFETYTNGNTPSLVISPPAGGATVTITSNTNTSGHYLDNSTPTSISSTSANSCGTSSPTFNTGSNNSRGSFNVGATSGTDCTLTFSTAASHFWACAVGNNTTGNLVRPVETSTTVTKLQGVFSGADKISYVCYPY